MRSFSIISLWVFVSLCLSCRDDRGASQVPEVHHLGAMRDAMWKGVIGPVANVDSLNRSVSNLYGIGPLSGLQGEILVLDGQAYVARVNPDKGMVVSAEENVGAPFFVYAGVQEWRTENLPASVTDLAGLETYLDGREEAAQPFVFLLKGMVEQADIHVQNLPAGSRVSSPQEAHRGQVNFSLANEEVELLGFFSRSHAGVFTHHGSLTHLHLISRDRRTMGHLDAARLGRMQLLIPD